MKSYINQGVWLPLALSLMVASPGWCQEAAEVPVRFTVSRQGLQDALQRYDRILESKAYSDAMKRQARQERELIRTRLESGDFQVGDQVGLSVDAEDQLTGTFIVQEGPSLELPGIGRISLAGVLRSELEDHLRKELGRYIRQPMLRAESSIRIVMTGGIGRPGYHVFPTSMLLSDALMAAGGPSTNARLDRLRIEREGESIWEGETVQQAIVEGRTLDRMSLQAGDEIVIPIREGSRVDSALRYFAPIGLLLTTITALAQIL